jgi:hypothetical protein
MASLQQRVIPCSPEHIPIKNRLKESVPPLFLGKFYN